MGFGMIHGRTTNLRAYFISFLAGDVAVQVLAVATAWSVYQIHHRAFDLGLVGLVSFAPSLVLVLVTGHVADRYDRKCTLLWAFIAEALLSLVLGGLVWMQLRSLTLFLGVVLVIGIARAFGAPLEGTILVSLVEPERYMAITSRYSSLRELVGIGGPAVGGAIVAFSPVAGFATGAALLLIAAAIFTIVGVPRTVVAAGGERFSFAFALEGVRFIRSRPIVLGAISLDLFAVLFGGATALLPIYADAVLHVGAFGFGVLRGSGGIGAALMALALSHWPPSRHVGRTLLWAVAAYGVATLVFAFSRNLWLSVAALAAAAAFDMISVVIRRGLVQLNTSDAMRGRVNAVSMMFIGASSELGSFESGTVAQLIGAVPAVAVGGLATLGVVGLWSWWFPALRRSDQLVGPAAA